MITKLLPELVWKTQLRRNLANRSLGPVGQWFIQANQAMQEDKIVAFITDTQSTEIADRESSGTEIPHMPA